MSPVLGALLEYRFSSGVGDRLLHMLSVFARHIIKHSPTDQCIQLPTGTHPHASSVSPGRALFTVRWV